MRRLGQLLGNRAQCQNDHNLGVWQGFLPETAICPATISITASRGESKILTTRCRKALCSLFPLGLPSRSSPLTGAQLPNITQAVLYWGVTVSMSGNRIDEQMCDSRAERSQP